MGLHDSALDTIHSHGRVGSVSVPIVVSFHLEAGGVTDDLVAGGTGITVSLG